MTRIGLASGERMGSGFLLEELAEVRELVEKDSPDATPLLSAIDETLDGNDVYDSVPKNSRR